MKNNFFLQVKRSNSAFTLMEIIVSIAILGVISSAVMTVMANLIYSGKKDQSKIEMNSEIVNSIAIVKKYIKESDELKILNSNISEKNILGNRLNGILIKNKNTERSIQNKSSLFTLIKPLEIKLSGDFGEKSVGGKNFHLGITDLNLFSDLQKDGDDLYFTDPGNGYVWKEDSSGVLTKISGFQYKGKYLDFLTPTGILIGDTNIYFSDTYRNLIFYVPKTNFSNSEVKILAGKIGEKTDVNTGEKSFYVISGYQDGSLGRNTLNHPKGLALYDNYLYFADSGNNAIRVINLGDTNNNIETFIGNGEEGISEDGTFHESFLLNNPSDIDIRGDIGMVLVSDTDNNRIIASGPFSGTNSYSKPFTIAGVGKVEAKNLSDGFFNLDDKFVGTNEEKIEEARNVGQMGFGGDFFLANNAILNHPTGIKFFGTGGFVFADSGNNLIRKVSIWDYGQGGDLSLFDNVNRIETIIGNASEILIKEGEEDSDGNKLMDIKISVEAPKSGNKAGSGKLAFLDDPMGLSFSGSDILFTDLQIFRKKLYGKINICDGDCLNGVGDVKFLKEKAFNALNLDKISITNLGDFISKTPLDAMQFEEKFLSNGARKIISIYLKFVNYLKINDEIGIDVRTSVENRN